MITVYAACLTVLCSGYKAESIIPVASAIPAAGVEDIGHELSELEQGIGDIALLLN
jgi:hypothetical protein